MKIVKAACRAKAATSMIIRSSDCTYVLRFKATKLADVVAAAIVMVHLRNSTGMINRN